jgi:hypothetical protein
MNLTHTSASPGSHLEQRVIEVGKALSSSLGAVLDALPDGPHGPQALATALGLDKVLTSRVLKAVRSIDPISVVHRAPGPEPLRRLLKAAKRRGVGAQLVEEGDAAVSDFERMIRTEAGDRSSLGAMLSAWLPEARQEFELRRKQSAFKAMSQLKGVSGDVDFSTVMLAPSDDGDHLDVVWVLGQYGVQRLRPGTTVKFVTRRVEQADAERRPCDLGGAPIDGIDDVRLDQFCHAPPAPLISERHGDEVQYTLGDSGFGPRSTVDVVFAEVNRREIRRYVPVQENRKSYVFAEVSTPVKLLVFDILVHRDVYPGSEPELHIYDTHGNGIADPNDSSRDIDRFDIVEDLRRMRTDEVYAGEVPKHRELMNEVFTKLEWSPEIFRAYRCRVEYPIYGSQLTVVFDPPSEPV